MELLVIAACLYGQGCTESYQAYYNANPELQGYVKHAEMTAEQKLGPNFTTYGAPILLMGAQRPFTIKMSQRWAIKGEQGCLSNLVYFYYF